MIVPNIKEGDLVSVRQSIAKLRTKLGSKATPSFSSIKLTDLDASEFVFTDSAKTLVSVDVPLTVSYGGTGATSLTDHAILVGSGTSAITALSAASNGQLVIGSTGADPVLGTLTGTANQVNVANGAGTITLSLPQDIHTGASPTWVGTTWTGTLSGGSQESPIDLTILGTHNGLEFHYAGNSYSVTGIRSRAQLITLDTTATAQGALLQAANNDGINAGVLNGALIEAIGKSSTTPATISTMRGALVNCEWGAYDTVTTLHGLHIRVHTLNNAGAGSFGTGCALTITNEAVGGNGQAIDSGIQFEGINLSGGNCAFVYGINFGNGVTYENADINLSKGQIWRDGKRFIKEDNVNYNCFFGSGAFNNDDGQFNVGFGYQAGNNNTTGAGNKGKFNVYIGTNSGFGDGGGSEGYKNVGIGYRALQYIATGYGNVAIGNEAARNLAGGYNNMAIGAEALYKATIGKWNTAIGTGSLGKLTVGICDVGVGYYSGYRNTSGHFNLNLGSFSGYYNETGDDNVAIGSYSGGYGAGAVNNHSDDTFIGSLSGYSITTGSSDIFIGYKSGYNQTTNSDLLIIDNQDRGSIVNEATQSLLYGTFNAIPSSQSLAINGDLNIRHHLVGIPDEITTTSEGVAASLDTINTEVTTNGDSDLDNVTLANGTSGQIKHIYCVVEGNAADTWKITPATMVGGTQITFAGVGEGCTLVYADNEGWCVVANNGGTVS